MLRTAIVVTAFGLLVAQAASGQDHSRRAAVPVPTTQGFSLGAYSLVASGITIQGPGMDGQVKTNLGEGGGIQLGYGFTPGLMVFASADVSRQGTDWGNIGGSMGLAHLEVGGRLSFPAPRKRLVPYLTAFVGKRGLAAHSDGGGLSVSMRLSGTEVGGGGGILYAFSPAFSLDAGLLASHGKLDRMELTGDVQRDGSINVDASTNLRLKVGFQWHP
jgi:hypothetical protein